MNTNTSVIGLITREGVDNVVKGQKVREILGVSFSVKSFKTTLTGKQREYVNRKLKKYNHETMKVIKKLKNDKTTRQAVLHFDLTGHKPECMQLMQFMIRNNKLYMFVYSRSLDAKNKLEQDIEVAYRFAVRVSTQCDVDIHVIKFYVGNLHYYL